MRGTTIGRIVLLVGALATTGCSYNRLVGLREDIDAAWAQVENQLQRRNDLIPNLVEVTKGYARTRRRSSKAVANARSRLLGANTRDEKIGRRDGPRRAPSGGCWRSPSGIPDLKANAQFAELSDELAGTRTRIAVERMRYNDASPGLQHVAAHVPDRRCGRRGSASRPPKYFEAPAGAKEVPKVDLRHHPE
jgi:LemA protein